MAIWVQKVYCEMDNDQMPLPNQNFLNELINSEDNFTLSSQSTFKMLNLSNMNRK